VHIGKAGGTSWNQMLSGVARSRHARFTGGKHFDLSSAKTQCLNCDLAIHFRSPVSLAISHHAFFQGLAWSSNIIGARQKNIAEYLDDYELMLKTTQLWRDGNAMMGWLLGTSYYSSSRERFTAIASLKHKDKMSTTDIAIAENYTRSCLIDDDARHLAAKRLRGIFYFGFLDYKLNESMQLLQEQAGLSELPKLSHANKGSNKSKKLAPMSASDMINVKAKLADLKPNDIWIYNYAKSLFDARIQGLAPCDYPPTPPMPKVLCRATNYRLQCDPTSAMGAVDFTRKTMGLGNLKLIPKAFVEMQFSIIPPAVDQFA